MAKYIFKVKTKNDVERALLEFIENGLSIAIDKNCTIEDMLNNGYNYLVSGIRFNYLIKEEQILIESKRELYKIIDLESENDIKHFKKTKAFMKLIEEKGFEKAMQELNIKFKK